MKFAYELRDAGRGTVHATGFSVHFWLDRETRRPVSADPDVMRAFAPYLPAR